MASGRSRYGFAWPNPAANPVRIAHAAVFLIGFVVPLSLAALGMASFYVALVADSAWMTICLGAGFLIDVPYVLGASVNITPTGLAVKRYFLLQKTLAWRNVKSLRLQNQKARPVDPILRHVLFNQPHSDVPSIKITMSGTSSREEESVEVFLQDPDAFMQRAGQFLQHPLPP